MPDNQNRLLSLLIPTVLLMVASLSILHSIVPGLASYQLIFASVGMLVAYMISRFDIDQFSSTPWVWYALAVVPLTLTEVFGIVSRGSTRWIVVFGTQFQTSEFAKFSLILFTAIWLTTHNLENIRELYKYVLLMAIPVFLVFIQPDLGSSIMVASIAVIGILTAGTPLKHLLLISMMVSIVIPVASLGLKSYQRERIISFINPYHDQLGSGYNSIQATIAVGSGQLLGRGLGQGTQSHLKFLPERHTDFIFASFIEELGFLGGTILIGAYIWLILNMVKTAKVAHSSVQSLVTLLTAGLFLTQTLVNIGMNMSILPITGVTLPLVSYGGSSLISTCLIIGLNWSVIRRSHASTSRLEIQ